MLPKILYMVIAKNKRILCDYTKERGQNYTSFAYDILGKLQTVEGQMICTYHDCEYMYIKENDDKITYLVLVDKGYDKIVAFKMLDIIKKEFQANIVFNHTNKDYENLGNVAEYSLNDKFRSTLVNLFETYKDAGGTDNKIQQVINGLDNTTNILILTMQGLTERDE